MNKSELLEIVSKRTNISKRKLEEVLKQTKLLIAEVLNKGGKLEIKDFGKLEMKESNQRLYRNPITKRLYYSDKKRYVKLKLFKKFKYMFS